LQNVLNEIHDKRKSKSSVQKVFCDILSDFLGNGAEVGSKEENLFSLKYVGRVIIKTKTKTTKFEFHPHF
jgi:hypothetical protein